MFEELGIKNKSILYGFLAVLIVVIINFLVLGLLGFPPMALEIIGNYIILIILVIAGFGLHVGVFTYFHASGVVGKTTAIASGGVSSTSMILCCSHYLVTLLPFLGALIGVSALNSLSQYTVYFLWLGILSNIVGMGLIFVRQSNQRGVEKSCCKKVVGRSCCGGWDGK